MWAMILSGKYRRNESDIFVTVQVSLARGDDGFGTFLDQDDP